MCGIAGVYSTTAALPERELFESLLMLNVYRGKDSTGIIRMNSKRKPGVQSIKAVMPSPGFITTEKGNQFLFNKEAIHGFIGHTRAATKGDITVKNAHPFSFPNVVGVHNGTIHWGFEGSKEYDTDSEALYALINKYGIEEALNKIAHASPAYALVFVDKKENTLNFVRNEHRPLVFTYVYARSTLVWSSDGSDIRYALKKRPTSLTTEGWEKGDKTNEGIFTLKPNHLLTIKIGESAATAKIKELNIKDVSYTYSGSPTGYGMGGSRAGTNNHSGANWKDSYIKGEDGVYRSPAHHASWAKSQNKSSTDAQADDEYGNFHQKHGTEALSRIPWLDEQEAAAKARKEAKEREKETEETGNKQGSGKKTEVILPVHGSMPQSRSELEFKLSRGCFCCGTPVDPTDEPELARVKWWSRDWYACGNCYEGVTEGSDWVKICIDDDYTPVADIKQVN